MSAAANSSAGAAGPAPALSASSKSLPTALIRSYSIQSIQTDIMVQLFSDRIFLSVTQLSGKLGSLLSVSVEDSVIDNSRTYNVSTLLGRRDDATSEVMGWQIAERIAALGGNKPGMGGGGAVCPPILFGFALKKQAEGDPAVFRAIVELLLQTYKEAIAAAAAVV